MLEVRPNNNNNKVNALKIKETVILIKSPHHITRFI